MKIGLKNRVVIGLLLMVVCIQGFGQTPLDTLNVLDVLQKSTWITNRILGLDEEIKIYKLTAFESRKFAGDLTVFDDTGNFTSEYTAFCGNDNFTTVNGFYSVLNRDILKISVDSVSYHGMWERPTVYRKKCDIHFKISKQGEEIRLTKID